MSTQNLEINKNSYIAFDATSLRNLIIDRLNNNNVFTDQNFVGSNISAIIEIISYSFSTLMYYLNKTSTESMFTEAQLYENINRIVKLIGYDPIGNQTASTSFSLSANNMPVSNYVIPRYTYTTLGGVTYSLNKDISFTKTNLLLEDLSEVVKKYRLYQGKYIEYPPYNATGAENEIVFLTVDDETIVDHFNIDIYVQDNNTTYWKQWSRVDNLFMTTSQDTVFEIRFNENKKYEIKFGDGVNGKKLNAQDTVSIFYLESRGTTGEIGIAAAGASATISKYNSINYNTILIDTLSNSNSLLSDTYYKNINLINSTASTTFAPYDSADTIRNKAPKSYKTQNRLITDQDFISHINSNFSNFVADVAVVNNTQYLEGYMQYYYDIGISSPQLESRILFNQVQLANACNFNNIYIIAVPRTKDRSYLMPSQKEIIVESIEPLKSLTTEIIITDPVYVAADIAVKNSNTPTLADIDQTDIIVEVKRFSRRSNESIRDDIKNIMLSYFQKSNLSLGNIINLYQIYSDILNIDGVDKFYCKRTESNIDVRVEGISLILWNPVYPDADVQITTQNIKLPYFKYVYLQNVAQLINKIKFISPSSMLQNVNV